MALGDVTNRQAVLDAMKEFRREGRDEFLRVYGFGKARRYFVVHDGIRYDSKAIVGAAHWHQHGVALGSGDFSGGDETVARLLRDLGFTVEVLGDLSWQIEEGQIVTRADVKDLYGGSPYGGIEASSTSPNVLVYTDPAQGTLSGYNFDGWDRDDESVFYYTGEGRRGDQTLTKGNKSILEHEETGRTLRLFEAIDRTRRRGGKRHRYIGAFHVDPDDPYRIEQAPDADGNSRQVVVFRLIHESATTLEAPPYADVGFDESPATTEPAPPDSLLRYASEEDPADESHSSAPVPNVDLVPSERNTSLENEIPPRAGGVARREEAQLVSAFESNLRAQGHDTVRARITIPGEPNALVTDTYDTTADVLYEAKSKSDRSTIRLGIGQLLDYLRFLPRAHGRLLLPDRPSNDLCALIKTCGLGLAYREQSQWIIDD